MFNPIRALRDVFDVQAANKGWDYKLTPPKLSPERRRELLEASALETPRSWLHSWGGILAPYWTKSGPKEVITSALLLGGSIMAAKWMIDMQVDFSFLSREVMDSTQIIFDNIMNVRPDMFVQELASYPELQQTLTDNPVLQQMLEKYPDTTSFRQLPDVAAFINQSAEHATDWNNFLRNSPKMEEIFLKFPGMAELAQAQPDVLEQIGNLDVELGKKLWNNGETQSQLWRMTQIFATDFFTNWGKAASAVVQDGPFSDSAKEALNVAWNSKDFINIVGKFMPLAIISYKGAQTAALRWRAWTTGYYATRWLDTKAFHRLKNEFNIDNPDQRIQDDPYRFTSASVNLVTGSVRTVLQFTAYAGILWNLANMNMAYFGGPDYVVPGTMFWFAGSYAAGLTALTWAAGRKLPEIGRNQQMREANFRSTLKKVQDNTDQIALNGTEEMEKQAIRKAYVPVLNNQVREINTNIKLSIVDVTFGNLSIPVPMMAGAFAIASGSASMGTLQLLNSSFGVVTSGLSFFASRFEQFAGMQAIASRLTQFDTAVEAARYLEEEKRQAQLRMQNGPTGPSAV
ncbi:MAG: hypothetical protein KKA05_11455 [Alphaproteobacteria bacterium]|nr:hypothetical protein [Alphaproteobacteria bacterium]